MAVAMVSPYGRWVQQSVGWCRWHSEWWSVAWSRRHGAECSAPACTTRRRSGTVLRRMAMNGDEEPYGHGALRRLPLPPPQSDDAAGARM